MSIRRIDIAARRMFAATARHSPVDASVPDYKYLIIGGGMAAASAITGIREIDDAGSIGVVTAEPHIYWNVYGSIGAGRRSIGSVIDL